MSTKKILVIGGAGYIGSHMVLYLQEHGFTPIVLDNLSTGHRHAVNEAAFTLGDAKDRAILEALFKEQDVMAVMYFASFIQVGESIHQPGKYYENNVATAIHLLNEIVKARIKYFIFSSSAAVYGEPQYTPIDEQHPLSPINPYGHSKAMVEQILQDFANSYNFSYASLRYFNAAGADPLGRLQEAHDPETHLIPLLLQSLLHHKKVTLFGTDYPTADGTCIRDYIHVNDLCSAHLLALEALTKGQKQCIYNLGNGRGYSVQEVIQAVEKITGKKVSITYGKRRIGDPAVLVADSRKINKELNWNPEYPNIEEIIQHAWNAMQSIPA